MTFQLAKNLDWYVHYKHSFEAILESNSAFEEMTQMESEASFLEMMNTHLLYEAYLEGKLLGIICVVKDQEYLFNGYVIYEEFIFEPYRGKNYAAALQRHLIEQLPFENNEMIYGTIHYDNYPSKKTALRVGRKCTHQFVFANI